MDTAMEPDGPAVGVHVMDGVGLPVVEGDDPVAEPMAMPSVAPFALFYGSSRDKLVRGLALTLGDAHLAAEAIDEAMTRAYQRWDRVGAFDDPAGWVYRVGLNWASSISRRRRRAPAPPVERGSNDVDQVSEPAVKVALAALTEAQRSVIICRYYLGLSEAETAALLRTRPGTVKSRLSRGLQQMQTRLGHLRDEENQ